MEASKLSVRVRAVEADDVPTLGQMAYESFSTFNASIGLPAGIDWGSVEGATASMKFLSSTPPIYGLVAVDNTSGALMGAGFIHPGDVYGIGPVYVNKDFQGRGVGRELMTALLEKAKDDGAKSTRLCQVTANTVSFSLYASVGFTPVECWTAFEGVVTLERAAAANRSVGFEFHAGNEFRKMEESDTDDCAKLHEKAMGFNRANEINVGDSSFVVTRDGSIIAYTTGFALFGHAIADSEEDLAFLFTRYCQTVRPGSPPPTTFHVAGRVYPRLARWSIAAKLTLRRHIWLMTIGSFQLPQHGMAWNPSILH